MVGDIKVRAAMNGTALKRLAAAITLVAMALGLEGCSTTSTQSAQEQEFTCHRLGARFRHSCSPAAAKTPVATIQRGQLPTSPAKTGAVAA
jgi:hypothetical protein